MNDRTTWCWNCRTEFYYKRKPRKLKIKEGKLALKIGTRWYRDKDKVYLGYTDFLNGCPSCLPKNEGQKIRKEYGLRRVRSDKKPEEHKRMVTRERVKRWRAKHRP